MKILVINDYAFVEGGAGKVAIESAIGLANAGHEVVFFSAVGPVDSRLTESSLQDVICLGQKDLLNNKNRFDAAIRGIYNNSSARQLKVLLEKWRPEIVHVHGVSKALSWSIINTIFNGKFPVVFTLHDFGLVCPNMGIYNFRKDELCDLYSGKLLLKCMVTNCDKRSYAQKAWRWTRYVFATRFLRIKKKIAGFVAVSDFTYRFYEEIIPAGAPIAVINNPIPERVYDLSKVKTRSKDGGVSFIFAGRLSTEKGLDVLLSAVKYFDAGLTIIGKGELEDYCKKLASESGGRMKVYGWQTEEGLAEKIAGSTALVLPSKVMETAGMVILEAAKYHVPSVVPDRGGFLEFVKDGYNGLHFKSGDTGSLKTTLEKLIDDPGLGLKLGQNAGKYFKANKERFSINVHVQKLLDFYKKILDY